METTVIIISQRRHKSNKKSPPACRDQRGVVCSSMQLSLNLHPILESEHQPPIMVSRGFLNHRQPESVVKLRDADLSLMHSEHKSTNKVCLGLPLLFLFLEVILPGLGVLVPRNIAVVPFGVLILALGATGVLLDTPLGQLRHHRDFTEQLVQFCVNSRAVGDVILHDAAVFQQGILAIQQLVERSQEPGLNVLLQQMRRAALFLVAELAITLPDNPAVLAVGVPDLGSIVTAAVAADQPGGKYSAAAVVEAHAFAPSKLGLDNIKLVGLDDRLVAPLDPILLDLALVDLTLFTEEINRVAFLKSAGDSDTNAHPCRIGGADFLLLEG